MKKINNKQQTKKFIMLNTRLVHGPSASYKTRNGNGETETKRTEQETTPKILILLTVRHACAGLDCNFKYESPQRLI